MWHGPEEAADQIGRAALDRRNDLLQPARVERQAGVGAGDDWAAGLCDGVVTARRDIVATNYEPDGMASRDIALHDRRRRVAAATIVDYNFIGWAGLGQH